MRLGIAGAGFAGLSVCYHALKRGFQVTLFDPKGIGNEASGASTGLLHPFVGKTASKSWRAEEGMEATKELLRVSSNALGLPVASFSGIFRPAVTEAQKADFRKNEEAIWKEMIVSGNNLEGLWISEGITVFSRKYLDGLFLACKERGAVFKKEPLTGQFERVVYATGSHAKNLCKHINFRSAIGQSIRCRWENPLSFSMSSQKYIALTESPDLCQIGSTYEHTKDPDPKKARELLEKAALFYRQARGFNIEEIRFGERISPKQGHQPVILEIRPKTFVFTGLGSRGLLYHALLGKELVSSLI